MTCWCLLGWAFFFPSLYLGQKVPLNEIVVLVLTSEGGKEAQEY